MFSSRRQIAEVCRVLTQYCGDEPFWTSEGPTATAIALRDQVDPGLDGPQRVLFQLALWFWEGGKGPPFGTVVELLDKDSLRRVGSLMIALSEDSGALDRWLMVNGTPIGSA